MPSRGEPASFEALKDLLSTSVDQLVAELTRQQVNYGVPASNVLALLDRTALVQERSFWEEWESWALRHVLPVHDMIEHGAENDGLTPAELEVLRKRLMDLLGYAVLGLVAVQARKGAAR